MKKVISLLMALTMLLSLLPVGALADEAVTGPVEAEAVVIEQATEELEEAEESAVSEQAFEEHAEKTEAEPGSIIAEGTCGENLTWVLDSEGTLTISGTGAMEDYSDGESMIETPWFESLESIKKLVITEGVTSIGEGAFALCSSVTEISIPDSVESIGEKAFALCSITEVSIPAGVANIGTGTFALCNNLTNISVAEANNNYSSVDGVLFSKDKSCLLCYPAGKSDTSYVIPEGVTDIGYAAFYCCSSLESITIPDGVTVLGGCMFYGCSGLKSVTIPDGVTFLGEYMFCGCSSLESITIPDGVTVLGGCMFYGCSGLKSVTIPDGVTVLGEEIFYGCSSLESITIPDSILSIGACAFLACIALKDIYYGGTEEGWNAVSIGINNSCLKNAAVHYAKGPSGFCGAEGDGSAVAWQYYNNGTLTISGTGAMSDFFD